MNIRGDTIFANNTAEEDGGEVVCWTCDMILIVRSGRMRCDNKTKCTGASHVCYAGTNLYFFILTEPKVEWVGFCVPSGFSLLYGPR